MKEFLLAFQFLTIIPFNTKEVREKALSRSVIYFPLIGLLLSFLLMGMNNLLLHLGFLGLPVDIMIVVMLIALTGGMHLDGLADTADAFLSRKNKPDMLAIMRDSHIGVMGVLSLISVILLKIALLSSISVSFKPVSLLMMCILGRWSMVFSMYLFPYARQEGKAKIYIEGMTPKIFIIATIIAILPIFIAWRVNGLLVFALIATCCYLIASFINKRINGITGDTLGAMNELIEVISLLFICVIEKGVLWTVY